jgi:hypothetical protein
MKRHNELGFFLYDVFKNCYWQPCLFMDVSSVEAVKSTHFHVRRRRKKFTELGATQILIECRFLVRCITVAKCDLVVSYIIYNAECI